MASREDIATEAMDMLGQAEVVSLDAPKTNLERRAARLFGRTLEDVLKMHHWDPARAMATLSVFDVVGDRWPRAAELPSDCLIVWSVADLERGWQRVGGRLLGDFDVGARLIYGRAISAETLPSELVRVVAAELAVRLMTGPDLNLSAARRRDLEAARDEALFRAMDIHGSEGGERYVFQSRYMDALGGLNTRLAYLEEGVAPPGGGGQVVTPPPGEALAFTPPAAVTVQAGATAVATLAATGGTPPYTFAASDPRLEVVGAALRFVAPAAAGQVLTTLTVTDAAGGGITSGTVTITVEAAAQALTFEPPLAFTVEAGAQAIATLGATGGQPPYTFAVLDTSALEFVSVNQLRFVSPAAGNSQTTARVSVTDAAGASVTSQTMTITVLAAQAPLVFSPPLSVTRSEGEVVMFSLTASGGTPPYAYELLDTDVLRIGGNQVLWDGGATVGQVSTRIRATDAQGRAVTSQPVTVTIQAVTATLFFTPPTAYTINEGERVLGTLIATGGVPPYTFSPTNDLLEVVSGNTLRFRAPAAAGTITTVLQARDSEDRTVNSSTVTVTVEADVTELDIALADRTITAGSQFVATLSATGGVPPYTFSVTDAGNLLEVTSGTTLRFAAAAEVGSVAATVTVTDDAGSTASALVTITVEAAVSPEPGAYDLSSNAAIAALVAAGTLTATRTGPAVQETDAGLLAPVAANVPRFLNGGVALEGAATNELIESERPDRAAAVVSGSGSAPEFDQVRPLSKVVLPNGASGSATGRGWTCTGLAYDDDLDALWVGNLGSPDPSTPVGSNASLIRLSTNGATLQAELTGVEGPMQGVAYRAGRVYYARSTGIRSIAVDGTGDRLEFAISPVNGLAHDTVRDRLYVSTGQAIQRRTLAGAIEASFSWSGAVNVDHLAHDPATDWLYVIGGGNNAMPALHIHRASDFALLKEYQLRDEAFEGFSSEGIALLGSELLVMDDAYYHASSYAPERQPTDLANSLIRYPAPVAIIEDVPASYARLSKGAGSSASDYILLQLNPSGQLADLTGGAYARAAASSPTVALRATPDNDGGLSRQTFALSTSAWTRMTATRLEADPRSGSVQIALRGTYGTSDEARVWLSGLEIVAGQALGSHIPTAGAAATRSAEAVQLRHAPGTYDITLTLADGSTQAVAGVSVTAAGYPIPATSSPVAGVAFALP